MQQEDWVIGNHPGDLMPAGWELLFTCCRKGQGCSGAQLLLAQHLGGAVYGAYLGLAAIPPEWQAGLENRPVLEQAALALFRGSAR